MLVQDAVLAGGHAGVFLELPHEMKLVVIAAECRQRMDGHFGGAQVEFCVPDSGGDDVLGAGESEKGFIQMLKMGCAYMNLVCQFIHIPFFGSLPKLERG